MKRAVLLLLPVLLGLSFVGVMAQGHSVFGTPTPTPRASPSPTPEPKSGPCPNITVQAQGQQPLRDGQTINFAVNIVGGDPKVQATMLWSTSAGTIKQGQYSPRIEVDSTGAGGTSDRQLSAEVWVGGYAPECLLQAKAAVKIIAPATKFGEFGEVGPETLTANIKTLANFLEQSQDNVYVFAYAGRKSDRGFAFTWVKRLKDELTMAGVAARRVAAVDGGFREEPIFEFWIVPAGAEPPRPTPTVNRNEIVYPKVIPPAKKP